MKKVLFVFALLVGVFAMMTGVMAAEGETDGVEAAFAAVKASEAAIADSGAKDAPAADATATEVEVDTEETAVAVTAAEAATDGVTVLINGKSADFDVAPQIVNDRTMVPLRAIFETMGAKVEWDTPTRTVTATKGETVVILAIDSTEPTINGKISEIDQPAIIVDSRTLAPLRFVAEAFGGKVDWNGLTRTAYITFTEDKATEETAKDDVAEEAVEEAVTEVNDVTELLYQGHASFRITAVDGTVIYVDPFAGEGYDVPADLILVTHQHGDHNKIDLVKQNDDCTVISNVEALKDGKHNSFTVGSVKVEAVEAGNSNHDPKECVGYLITVDDILIYAAGDTSKLDSMKDLSKKSINYALYPCDGVYNMGVEEAAECAKLIGAKNNIPYHMLPDSLFDKDIAAKFAAPNKLIVEAGKTITLTK